MTRWTFLALSLLAAPGFAASLTRGPFIQQTTSNSALIVARTDSAADLEITATAEGMQPVKAVSRGTANHTVKLDGLRPATQIHWTARVGGADASSGAFRTPGLPGTAAGRQATIGVIGDMGSAGPLAAQNAGRLAERGIDLLLTVGDNSYPNGAPGEWDSTFFRPFAAVLRNATAAPSLGDHEYLTPNAQGYLDAFELPPTPFNERAYSFDWGDVHVAVVDTNCLDPLDVAVPGCSPDQVKAWLEEDLTQSKAVWKLITMHRGAVASGRYGAAGPVARVIIPIAEAHGVDLVFQGHNHFYERTWPMRAGAAVKRDYVDAGAPVYVTTGGGGDWVYESTNTQPDWSAFRTTDYEHMVLTVKDGELRAEAIHPDGTALDSFTLKKTNIPPATSGGSTEQGGSTGSGDVEQPGQSPSPGATTQPGAQGGEASGCSTTAATGGLSFAFAVIALAGWRRRRAGTTG